MLKGKVCTYACSSQHFALTKIHTRHGNSKSGFFSNSCLLSNERILLLKVHYCFKNLANEKLIAIDKLFNIKIVY